MPLIDRRKLTSILMMVFAVLCIAAVFYIGMRYFKNRRMSIPLNVSQETLHVGGLTNTYTLYFLADSHITLTDERDTDAVRNKETMRNGNFSFNGILGYRYFDAMIADAKKEEADMVILGGDIIDSAMLASVEHVEDQLKTLDMPYYYLTGNHDFEYGDEYFSEKAYSEYLPRLNTIHGDRSYHVAEYEDLIVFTADDSNNQITEDAYKKFEEVIAKGKPVVVCLHVPLEPDTEDDSFIEQCKEVWRPSDDGHSRVSIGPNGCSMNEITEKFYRQIVKEESPVFLVLAGHVHFYHKDKLNKDTLQIVTGAAYEGNALRITLCPPER